MRGVHAGTTQIVLVVILILLANGILPAPTLLLVVV